MNGNHHITIIIYVTIWESSTYWVSFIKYYDISIKSAAIIKITINKITIDKIPALSVFIESAHVYILYKFKCKSIIT